MGFGGLGLGVEDVDDDRSSVVVVEGVSLVVGEASVEVSVGVGVGVGVGEVGEETGSVADTDALVVISLDAEDVSEGTTGEEDDDDELTASGVTAGSDEIDVILLDISAELYDVDDISVKDEDDDGSTEVTVTNDALCWVEEGAVLEEDTALQSPNPFWQVLGAQYASVLPQYEY